MEDVNRSSITYEAKGHQTFMVIQPAQGAVTVDYYAKMVELNNIPGLLPMFRQTIDGSTRFFYEISGKTKIVDYTKKNRVNQKQGRTILGNLVNALIALDRFFLSAELCLLDKEYVFIDDTLNVYLPLIPVSRDEYVDNEKKIREFLLDLLGSCFISEERNDVYDVLIKRLISPNYNLVDFAGSFKERVQPNTVSKRKPAPLEDFSGHQEVSKPAQQDVAPVEKPTDGAPKQSSEGFKIPGSPSMPVPGTPPSKKKKAKKEKPTKKTDDGLSLFGFRLGKKKESPKVEMQKENHQLPADSQEAEKQKVPPKSNQKNNNDGESWVGTSMLNQNQATTHLTATVDGQQIQEAYLVHRNRKIDINQLPFSIGKLNVDYEINDSAVSRQHATIMIKEGVYCIQDENSKNHTYVNGSRIPPYSPVELENGDIIRLGREEMSFSQGG